jgi:hypothetical protein
MVGAMIGSSWLTMPADGRDRPAGGWVVVLIVRGGPDFVISR